MGNQAGTPTDPTALAKPRAVFPGAGSTRPLSPEPSRVRNGGMQDDVQIDESDDIEEPTRDLGPVRSSMERPDLFLGRDRGVE